MKNTICFSIGFRLILLIFLSVGLGLPKEIIGETKLNLGTNGLN